MSRTLTEGSIQINELGPINPLFRREVCIMDGPILLAAIELTVRNNNGQEILLQHIRASETGKGYGSLALEKLKEWADSHNARITGVIGPTGNRGMSYDQLESWYKRHGFTIGDGGIISYRGMQK